MGLSGSVTTRLAQHLKARRLEAKLTLAQLSRLVRYRDTGKGAGRIHKFEESGAVHPELLVKLSTALGVDRATVEALVEEDRRQFFRQWNAWANEPIKPYLVVRMVPAFYVSEDVPQDVKTVDGAEAFAAGRARHWRRKCCLVLSRRHSIWLDEEGMVYERTEAVPGEPNTPYMRLGRGRRSFLLRTVSPERIIQEVNWPTKPGLKDREDASWD